MRNARVPDDVAAAMEQAERAVELLRELDRQIVFVGQGPGVIAELRDGNGHVLKRLTAVEVVGLVEALGRR